jgi:hypothetical protein
MEQIDDRPGFVCTREGSVDDGILVVLRNLLAGLGLRWAYVARLDRAEIVACTPDLPGKWAEGRAFGLNAEVRWRKVGANRYRLDVLSEDQAVMPCGDGWQSLPQEIDGIRKRKILLWGELTRRPSQPADWREVRIPHPLEYPIPNPDSDKPRVALDCRDYLVGGIVVATRWIKLYPIDSFGLEEG